jgi:hypothetical protein
MCVPLAAVAIAATIASTAMSAYSSYQQQKSANAAANYSAQIQYRNAEIANMSANRAIQAGDVEAKQNDLRVSEALGISRASQGASGLLTDTGSNQKTNEDRVGFGALDSLTIRNNARVQAWGLQNDAANSTASGALMASRTSSPGAAALPSLLSGVSQLGGQLYQNKQTYGSYIPS